MTTPVGVSPSPPAARALSIVVATFNRAELLDRALATYARQTLDRDCWEYLLADDGSQDHTREVVEAWRGRGLPIRLFDAERDLLRPKTPGVWRDGSGLRNALSTFAVGRHLVSTHPEILLPPDALASTLAALDTAPPRSWVTAIPFWLPEAPEAVWGEWRGTRAELDRLRSLPGFWADDWPTPLQAPGAVDYRNQNQARRLDWQSEVFWGMPMALWRYMGGFREFDVWGSVDPDFWARRSVLGIETIPIPAKEGSPHAKGVLMVYHQNHASPRDMDVTHAALRAADAVRPYRSPVDVRATGGLAGNYHHGPRERAAEPGTLTGIMDDHVTRYRWAASRLAGAGVVLDVPCGTGYGAALLRPVVGNYVGVDIDAESVAVAAQYGGVTMVGSMVSMPQFRDGQVDGVCCFEGLEHVEAQAETLAEFARVLRPGGVLLLSTPQRGATGGTPWDRHMLTHAELSALFDPAVWEVAWFHQVSYGWAPVAEGVPPANAEIQIASARRR
jgi:SAM-dependent methyltransferase